MKKIIVLFAFLLLGAVTFAQSGTWYLNGKTYIKVQTDYTATNTTETWVLFDAPLDYKSTQNIKIEVDSTSGNHTNLAIALYGRVFSGDSWTQIGSTVNWKGTTSDTTVYIANTSANRYRQYKLGYTGTGTGVSTIDTQQLKLWIE